MQRQTFDTVLGRGSKPFAGESRAQREAGVRGAAAPDYRAEVSEVHKQLIDSVKKCSNDSKRFTRCARLHLLSAQRIYSAQRYTARSAPQCAALHSAQRCTAPSATQRTTLHCAQRFTASAAQCATLYTPPPPSQEEAARTPDNRTKPFAGEAERSGKREYCAVDVRTERTE